MAKQKKLAVIPRKRPEQDRSRATVDAIIAAAAHVLVRAGYAAFTTNRVAEKAGVSIGSLYQYFPNKESLLGELMKRHMNDIEKTLEMALQNVESAPLEDLILTAVEQNIKSHQIDPELHRVLSEEVPMLGHLDWKKDYSKRIDARLRSLLLMKQREIAVPDIDLAVYIISRTTEAVVHNAVLQRSQDFASGALARELSRMLLGYLTGTAAPRKTVSRAAAE
jgi:AcrR family transcriptional regulator